MEIMFIITASIALVSSVMVVTRMNAVHALLYLIVSLLSVSVIFFMLGAPFAGALEVIIYAGAIMVLFIFVIMMLNLGRESVEGERRLLTPSVWVGPLLLGIVLAAQFLWIAYNARSAPEGPVVVSAKDVGASLFSTYLLGVEIAGLLLLAGIVGAFHLGKTKRTVYHRFLKEDRP